MISCIYPYRTVYEDLTVILIFLVHRNFLDSCAVYFITTEINAHMRWKMISYHTFRRTLDFYFLLFLTPFACLSTIIFRLRKAQQAAAVAVPQQQLLLLLQKRKEKSSRTKYHLKFHRKVQVPTPIRGWRQPRTPYCTDAASQKR
jgi:hypothetical protein